MHACVLSDLSFVITALVLAYTYPPTSNLQWSLKFTVKTVTSSLGENPPVIPDLIGNTFSHIHTLYTVYIRTIVGMSLKGKLEVVPA